MNQLIDSHVHLDEYRENERNSILQTHDVSFFIAVSMGLESCKSTLKLAKKHDNVKAAFGFHPEQELPTKLELQELFAWMNHHIDDMVAVGEVGLPYYKRQGEGIEYESYITILEQFIILAKKKNKPIILHAVYDDAPVVCDLLEKYHVTAAHFHWFKGDADTISRMIKNGYYISITPDVCYEEEIQQLVEKYPLSKMMVETDGPWEFDGPFAGKMTVPKMMHDTVRKIAQIKKISKEVVYKTLYDNTKRFYQL